MQINLAKTKVKMALLSLIYLTSVIYSSDILFNRPLKNLTGMDFKSFYFAGKALSSKENIYDTQHLNRLSAKENLKVRTWPYLYPPFLATLFIPLSKLPPATAFFIWKFLSIFFFGLIIYLNIELLFKTFSNFKNSPQLIIVAINLLLIFVLPLRANLRLGQINIFVLFFIMLSLYYYNEDRDIISGIFLSLAILIKGSPFILLIFFFFRKKYSLILSSLLSLIIFSLFSLPFSGLKAWITFLQKLQNFSPGTIIPGLFNPGIFPNFSLNGLFIRIFLTNLKLAKYFTIFSQIALLLILIFQTKRLKKNLSEYALLSGYFILMLINAPLAYQHHLIFLFPTSAYLFSYLLSSPFKSRYFQAIFLLILHAIFCFDFSLHYFKWNLSSFNIKFLTSINLYGLLIFFIYGINLYRKQNLKEAKELR